MALGWNPSNSVQDECYIKAHCQWGTESLFKVTNGKLEDRLLEAFRFTQKFTLRSFHVNEILGIKHRLHLLSLNKSLGMSDTLIW